MDHEKYQELLSRDMDNDLTEEEKKELQAHLKECENCRNDQAELIKIKGKLSLMEELEPGSEWKSRTAKEIRKEKIKKMSFRKFIPYAAGLLILILIAMPVLTSLLFTITGRSTSNDNGVAPDYSEGVQDGSSGGVKDEDTGGGTGTDGKTTDVTGSDAPFDISKIIYSGNISLYTEDYKGTFSKIEKYAITIGGFVQAASSSYIDKVENSVINSGYITIRVPAAKFNEAMKEIEKYGEAISSSTNSTNISQQYQDIKGQLESLTIQEERLLEYLTKADKIQDMLSIESELNRVRTEKDYRTTLINNWDKEISYSTIYVAVYEKELSTNTVKSPFSDMLQKIKEGFIGSINFLLNVIAELIVWIFKLLPFAVILGVAYFILNKYRNKK
ncbi:MAG: DUF4349 domain-containing protein [Eubacteriaceae bacterium]|nr:DUF4349 domain-containing protein [Eubacteriaceae bacterium]